MPLVFLMLYSLIPKIQICPATLITLEIVARCRYYPTTLKPSTTLPPPFSHCKSNHCHTAAFCQKSILEFVARCRWNGKKDFWATLLRTLKNFHPTSVILLHFAGKKINFSLQNLLNWLVCDRILNSAKSCLCFAYSLSIDFCLLVLTIIQHSFFLVSSIQFQMGPWFESWLRRRSLNRKLIFSRSALAWIFWLFWVRNDWIWLVWDRSLKWVTLDFLEKKNEIVMEKKLVKI